MLIKLILYGLMLVILLSAGNSMDSALWNKNIAILGFLLITVLTFWPRKKEQKALSIDIERHVDSSEEDAEWTEENIKKLYKDKE